MKKITLVLAFCTSVFWFNGSYAQKYGKTEQDSIECLTNNSLYQEFYKQKDYKDAYEPWKKVVEVCPQYHINTYIRGVNLLNNLIATSATQQDKDKYIDELLSLYDKRSAAFGEEWNNIARKAQTLEQYRPNQVEQIYNLYKEAADKGGNQLDQQYCVQYLQATINYLKFIKANSEQMSVLFDVYDYASETLEQAQTDAANDLDSATQMNNTKLIQKCQQQLDNSKINIASCEKLIEPFASCDKIIPIYENKFKANPNDLELLKKITTNLERKGCTESELFLQATENLYKLQPTPKSGFLMGQMLLGKKQYSEATKYFQEAENTFTDRASKAKAAFQLATTLMRTSNYAAARSAAERAANYDKSLAGRASLMVAQMYLNSSVSCSSHDGQIRGAAWCAYDEAARAKSLDGSIAGEANRIMGAARSQWPAKENMFFLGINSGSSFHVGCWIGRNTTVRTR
jgi:tetratricopeptide (TPR) repeat protein